MKLFESTKSKLSKFDEKINNLRAGSIEEVTSQKHNHAWLFVLIFPFALLKATFYNLPKLILESLKGENKIKNIAKGILYYLSFIITSSALLVIGLIKDVLTFAFNCSLKAIELATRAMNFIYKSALEKTKRKIRLIPLIALVISTAMLIASNFTAFIDTSAALTAFISLSIITISSFLSKAEGPATPAQKMSFLLLTIAAPLLSFAFHGTAASVALLSIMPGFLALMYALISYNKYTNSNEPLSVTDADTNCTEQAVALKNRAGLKSFFPAQFHTSCKGRKSIDDDGNVSDSENSLET